MEIPRSITDLIIGFPCQVCSGNGGFGMRRPDTGSGGQRSASSNFTPCTTCEGSGWKGKRPGELTPAETERLLSKLPKKVQEIDPSSIQQYPPDENGNVTVSFRATTA